MAKQTVNVGNSANDRTGDSLRSAFNKINENFTELYTQLGINSDDDLNLGAFEFTGSTLTTTDSSAVVIDQATTITSNLTVGGDILPSGNLNANLGSASNRFRDLYLSGSTIDLGGTTLSIVGGKLQVGGADVGSTVSYNEITDTPTIPSALSDLTNDLGDLDNLNAGEGIPDLLTAYTDQSAVVDSLLNAGDYGVDLSPPSDYTFYDLVVAKRAVNPLIPQELEQAALLQLNAYNAWQTEIATDKATITVGDYAWDFKGDGNLSFPDGTTQTTAWTGITDLTGSVFADDSTLLVDGINSALYGSTISITPNGSSNFAVGDFGYNVVTDGAYSSAIGGVFGVTVGGDVSFNSGGQISLTGNEILLNALEEDITLVSKTGTQIVTLDDAYGQQTYDFGVDGILTLPGKVVGDLSGSVFGDDSTLLVDGVNGSIVGPIDTAAEFVGDGAVSFNNDYEGDGFRGGFTTDKSILQIMGANYVGGGDDGGGITISAGLARNDGNRGDVIISTGSGGADGTGIISLLSDYITAAGTWIGTQTMNINGDIKGSVFADDSTLLVDGVNGVIPASVVSGTITNDIFTNSLETITDIRFGTYADARKPKISIAGIGEHDIAITAGYDVNGDDSGNVSINANTDGVTPGVVNIATSSGELSLGKSDGTTDVYGEVEFNGHILFQDGDGVEFNGPVDFSDADVQNFAPGDIYANSGQYLYVVGKYDGGSATNVAFIYDDINNRPRQIFYGKTEFANNGEAAIVDFTGATFTGEPWISVADLKTLVAASTDFEDFQTRIAAL